MERRPDLREHCDGPGADPEVVEDTLRTLARLNAGPLRTHAVLADHLLRASPPGGAVRVLDWGCGAGDAARALVRAGARAGLRVEVAGLDLSPVAVAVAREGARPGDGASFEQGDALRDGPDPAEFDFVVSSFLLHHLADGEAEEALRRSDRARRGFVHLDLVRSRAAWAAFLLLGRPFCRRRETFEDGLTSIRRALTSGEAAALASRAGVRARVEVHFPWRLCVFRHNRTP